MKKILFSLLVLLSMNAYSQDDLTVLTDSIVAEGKQLYKSEMASWYGTDLFLESYKDKSNIGGYFSYTENNISKCIFFSNSATPKAIGTISFDSTYQTNTANLDLKERDFSRDEMQLFEIRKKALEIINDDTLFKSYKNTSLNLIPLITGKQRRVYVLTGPQQSGVVIFGNDYLLTFDGNNILLSKKQLHRNIIPIKYGDKEEQGKEIEGTVHSHLPETGDFITATDICTLMLYEKFTNWKQHNVVSKNYLSIWNCKTDNLVVIPMGTIDKINKDQEKQSKKKSRD